MNKTLLIISALGLASCSSCRVNKPQLAHSIKNKPQLAHSVKKKPPQTRQQRPKQPKSLSTYMSKPLNPLLTKEEIKEAKGDWVWRKVPYAELSDDEKKDPNFWIGIDPKSGQIRSMMNP